MFKNRKVGNYLNFAAQSAGNKIVTYPEQCTILNFPPISTTKKGKQILITHQNTMNRLTQWPPSGHYYKVEPAYNTYKA